MKTAVVLFNLGGPDSPAAVKPFLFNLFHDPAILRLPQPFRWLLAKFIAARRAPTARAIYAELGGQSPIIEETEAQARALETALDGADDEYKVFIAMRYWRPQSAETAAAVKEWGAERVLLLPLYPQYSTTTTGSSITAWESAADAAGLNVPTSTICCYFDHPDFIGAHRAALESALENADANTRILFSAHGLPERIIKDGDPYQWQVEKTVAAIMGGFDGEIDYRICYQSRVGPVAWIGPATEDEIRRAGDEGKSLVVVPIAFVSEHSETLVELDIEYARLAESVGVAHYHRIPALKSDPRFIETLGNIVKAAPTQGAATAATSRCPESRCRCLLQERTEDG